MKKNITLIMVLLLMFTITLTGCGGGTEETASEVWPAEYAEVPEFNTSPIESLQVVDEGTVIMQFKNVTKEHLESYTKALTDSGFTYENKNEAFTNVVGDYSYAVGWEYHDNNTDIKFIILRGPSDEGLVDVVVQWIEELDGITPFQGYTPNFAAMNPDGLVTVDYSDVTAEALDAYRKALISDGFELVDLGTGVEAYGRIDDEGTEFLVLLNPQNDVEGHLQISGIIAPAGE